MSTIIKLTLKVYSCDIIIANLPFCRPTHLLESHVSGVLLKKETTEEGEVGADISRVQTVDIK